MLQVHEKDIDRITEAFHHLLKGRIPGPIELAPDFPENEIKQLVQYVNRFFAEYESLASTMAALSRGELEFDPPKGGTQVLHSFKNLHANLRHLTWKTEQIAKGDFAQKLDFMCDFSAAFNSMAQQLNEAFARIEKQNKALSEANEVIKRERDKSDRLLLNILPARVAEELKETGSTAPELFENVTVCFSDLVGFTQVSAELSPGRLIAELNDIFTQFDTIVEANGGERIKTIGDAYLAVCGMPAPNASHASSMVRAAIQMVEWLDARNLESAFPWRIRVGVHTGPVIGAVVGIKKYIYDVFGDTINTASRMEGCSEPMRINVSEATYEHVKDLFRFTQRPGIEVKGKGKMNTYLVDRDRSGHLGRTTTK